MEKQYNELHDLLVKFSKIIPTLRASAFENGQLAAYLKEWDKITAAETMGSNLAKGRKASIEKRRKKATDNLINLQKSVNDLFDSGEGYGRSNDWIVDFLIKKGFKAKPSYLKRLITPMCTKHRKHRNDKSGQ